MVKLTGSWYEKQKEAAVEQTGNGADMQGMIRVVQAISRKASESGGEVSGNGGDGLEDQRISGAW